MIPPLRNLRHVALDMDGTLYAGRTLFPATLPFLKLLQELELGYSFLTNNSSKSADQHLSHLLSLGIAAAPGQLYTSTQLTIEWLRQHHPKARRLFILGTAGLIGEFVQAGFAAAADDPRDEPQAVVVGFDTGLTFARLCRAAYWIKRDKLFVATHPDRLCPTDEPTLLVDCGSICACLQKATGRRPAMVLGKPDPRMLRGLARRHALAPGQLAMVGDRLDTDMAMARKAGAWGVLVLTGETRAGEAALCATPPDLVVGDLGEFGEKLKAARA